MTYTTPYQWRGKTYRTIRGLHTAVLKVYPNCGLSFGHGAMVLRFKSTNTTLSFLRVIEDVDCELTSVISPEPRE